MFHNLSGQLIPIFDHHHGKSFLYIKEEFPKFHIGSVALWSCPCAPLRRACLCLLCTLQLHSCRQQLLSHLFSRLNKPSPQPLFLCYMPQPLTILVACPLTCSSLSMPLLFQGVWNHNHKKVLYQKNQPLKNNEISAGTLGSGVKIFFSRISGHTHLSTKIFTS